MHILMNLIIRKRKVVFLMHIKILMETCYPMSIMAEMSTTIMIIQIRLILFWNRNQSIPLKNWNPDTTSRNRSQDILNENQSIKNQNPDTSQGILNRNPGTLPRNLSLGITNRNPGIPNRNPDILNQNPGTLSRNWNLGIV